MQVAERQSSSIVQSLSELRDIEHQRIADERAAAQRADAARIAEREEAERQRREAEEARAKAEREALLEIERARERAEREVRMRAAQAEAAERAHQQVILEQQRLQQEMELRRAEVARKRPTWMVAVTALALIAAICLVFFAVTKMRRSAEDSERAEAAQRERDRAVQTAREAQEKVDQLERRAADMIRQINGAITAVNAAQNDADRAAAKAKLVALQQAQREIDLAIRRAREQRERDERLRPVVIPEACKQNPFGPGCPGA
jgi:hypothetical protein